MKKRNFIYVLRLLFLPPALIFLSPGEVLSQQSMPGELPTPQAASLGQYGDVPVSLYSGTMSLSIPLLSTTVRGVKFDVHLDYNGSGIRVNSLPGPTGHGWTLNCGGVITRSVNGEYDEYIQSFQEKQEFGEIKPYFDVSSYPYTQTLAQSQETLISTVNQTPYHDYRPDIFYFNFMGMSGYFFLDSSGQWRVSSEHNLEILLDITDSSYFDYPLFQYHPGYTSGEKLSKTIKTIRIRDDRGNIYEFGGNDNTVEYSIGFLNMCQYNTMHAWKADSWYLSNVKDKYGNVLYQFTYERGPYVAQVNNGYQAISYHDNANMPGIPWPLSRSFGTSFDYSNLAHPFGVTINSPVYLTNVSCSNGIDIEIGRQFFPKSASEVLSTYYNTFYQLGNSLATITGWNGYGWPFYYLQTDDSNAAQYQYNDGVSDKSIDPLSTTRSKIYKYVRVHSVADRALTYELVYDYNARMHLKEINLRNEAFFFHSDTSLITSYKFGYDHFNLLPVDYSTRKADHWGYYKESAYTLANGETYYQSFKQQRDPDTLCVKYGALTSVIYPTGGEAVIEYEPHRFSRCVSLDHLSMCDTTGFAGGLRVKSLTLYDDTLRTQLLSRKEYQYKRENDSSSGELFAAPRYYWPHWGNPTTGGNGTAWLSLFRTASIVPLSNSFGTHVGYSRVVEMEADSSKTVYTFSCFEGNQDEQYYVSLNNGAPSPFDTFTDRSYRRGKLLSLSKYSSTNELVSFTSYTYGNGDEESACGYGLDAGLLGGYSSGATAFYAGSSYRLFYRNYNLKTEQTTLYPGNVTTRKRYERITENLPLTLPYIHQANIHYILSETLSRNNDSIKTEYGYPQQKRIDDTTSRKRACELFDLVADYKRVTHKGIEVSADSAVYVFKTINSNSRPVLKYELARSGGELTDTLTEYQEYTSTGQPTKLKRKGEPWQYLYWGYGDHYLYAKALGNHSTPLNITGASFFNRELMITELGPFRASHGVPVTTYTYEPLVGITSATGPDGITTYYNYDQMFRLQSIQDLFKNAITTYEYHFREP